MLHVTLSLDGCEALDLNETYLSTPSSATWRSIGMEHPILYLDPKTCCSHWQFFCIDLFGFRLSLETSNVLLLVIYGD